MEKQDRRAHIAAYKALPQQGGIYQIRNTTTGRILLHWTAEMQGSKNRFDFAVLTDSCVDYALQSDWKQYGKQVFAFEVLEARAQKETQTLPAFRADLKKRFEQWQEKLAGVPQY